MSFQSQMIENVLSIPKFKLDKKLGQLFSRQFVQHYQKLYDEDIKNGRRRKLPAISSAQSALSVFKKTLRDTHKIAAPNFLNALKLNATESKHLILARQQNVHAGSIDLPVVQGDAVIRDCREFLRNPNPYLKVVGLACLTGRRMAEIIYAIRFHPPTEPHFTQKKYWSKITGITKQRSSGGVKTREVPLFAPRTEIQAALHAVRQALPASNVAEVNRKYGKAIQRTMKEFCPTIGKLHQFRKFYAVCCYHYFNERNCSLPRVASDYLGHKTLSATVLTYLNFRVVGLGSLNFK